jgi:hypothetical protein
MGPQTSTPNTDNPWLEAGYEQESLLELQMRLMDEGTSEESQQNIEAETNPN